MHSARQEKSQIQVFIGRHEEIKNSVLYRSHFVCTVKGSGGVALAPAEPCSSSLLICYKHKAPLELIATFRAIPYYFS
jgi:hypothetical protein